MVFDEKDTLNIIQKEKVDILLISEQVGGYEFVREIRKNNPGMKIFMVGVGSPGGALEKDREKAIKSGANDFFNVVHVRLEKMLDIIMGRAKNDEQYFIDVRALFIVNEPDHITSDKEEFLSKGVMAIAVSNETDAMQDFNSNAFDIVIVESKLDILEKLLSEKRINPASVIILLDGDDKKTREEAEKLRVVSFINKSEMSSEQIAQHIKQIYNKLKFNRSIR